MNLNYCRLCMAQSFSGEDYFHDIYSKVESGEYSTYCESIRYCTGLEIHENDGFSRIICNPCVIDLTVAHKFINTCKLTDNKLQNSAHEKSTSDVGTGLELKSIDCKDGVEKESKAIEKNMSRSKGIIERLMAMEDAKKVNKEKKLRCDVCNVKFKSCKEVKVHKTQYHGLRQSRYVLRVICEVCGKPVNYNYKRHLQTHQEPNLLCDHCEYRTMDKILLAKHLRMHFKRQVYQCEYCPHTCHIRQNLRAHILRAHIKLKEFRCDICCKEFFHRFELQRHKESHMGFKRYRCEICKNSFTRMQQAKKHLFKQHGVTTEKMQTGPSKHNYKEIKGIDHNGGTFVAATIGNFN